MTRMNSNAKTAPDWLSEENTFQKKVNTIYMIYITDSVPVAIIVSASSSTCSEVEQVCPEQVHSFCQWSLKLNNSLLQNIHTQIHVLWPKIRYFIQLTISEIFWSFIYKCWRPKIKWWERIFCTVLPNSHELQIISGSAASTMTGKGASCSRVNSGSLRVNATQCTPDAVTFLCKSVF